MARLGPVFVAFSLLAAVMPACTDWDTPINASIAVSNAPDAADDTGLVWWDTVGSAGADAGSTTDQVSEDADATSGDDVVAVEILGADASDDAATADGESTAAAQDGLIAPDGVLDSAGFPDANAPCSGANRPIGCACAASLQCASGLCVNGPDGLVCSPSCKDVACPLGWTCVAPVLVCTLVADVNDTSNLPDAIQTDEFDTSNLPDAIQADGSDSATSDLPISNDLTGPDWQGYPDASFPDDADIYGGAINSCLSLYLYQQETCGKNSPAAACIDDVATQGSLYANYLFEPVRACQDAYCVDLCATAIDETCMNQCIGKNCANQFLSCVSNDQHGTADCKTTFSCSMGYPGKLLTIGAKCYANGTLSAQLQVGGLIACETKPNTDSCFQAVGDCYDQGAAATNSCMQTITCTQGCANNQDCVWNCLGKATPAARKAIDAVGDCIVTICGPKCNGDQTCQNACVGTNCGAQFSACTAN